MDLTCSLIYLAIFLLILIIVFFILQLLFRRTRLITVFFGILLLSNLTLLAINNWFGDIFNVVIDQNNLVINVDLLLYCTKNVLTIISLPITLFHTLFTIIVLNIFSTFMEEEREREKNERRQSDQKEVAKERKEEKKKLSFKEQKEYENLSKEIETLEKEIADIEASFSTIDSRDYEKMIEAKSTYDEKNRVLEEKFIRYMELDERA